MMVIMPQMQIPLIDVTPGDSWRLSRAASVLLTPYIVGKSKEIRMRRPWCPALMRFAFSGVQ